MRIARIEEISPNGNARELCEVKGTASPAAVLRRMSEIERQELQWLWPGRIPLGKLTLFAGDPGLGKSLATLDIAARRFDPCSPLSLQLFQANQGEFPRTTVPSPQHT